MSEVNFFNLALNVAMQNANAGIQKAIKAPAKIADGATDVLLGAVMLDGDKIVNGASNLGKGIVDAPVWVLQVAGVGPAWELMPANEYILSPHCGETHFGKADDTLLNNPSELKLPAGM